MTMDTSVFAYVTPAKPIRPYRYALSAFRKGEPEPGYWNVTSPVGYDWYRCVKYFDEIPNLPLDMPPGTYEMVQVADDGVNPYIPTHNPSCAVVRNGNLRAWCDCGKGDDV